MGEQTNLVRRKLLKAAVYAPPMILGSIIATPRSVMGGIGATKVCSLTGGGTVIITVSSGTNACCPCVPGSVKFDAKKCGKKQCELSCGVNCPPGVLAKIKCKKFCKKCGFTPAGCKKPCACAPHPTKPGKFKCV